MAESKTRERRPRTRVETIEGKTQFVVQQKVVPEIV